jgi:hypothetical protein
MNRQNTHLHTKQSIKESSPQRSTKTGSINPQTPKQVKQIKQVTSRQVAPIWLRSLLTIQRSVMVLFCSIFGLSAIGYGYTVYTQDLWKSQHGQLRRLQNQESQGGAMNENLKQKMAEDAESSASGLVAPSPDRNIFIPIAPQRPAKTRPTRSAATQLSQIPRGY